MARQQGLKELEREYALLLGRYETAEIAIEGVVGMAAVEAADRAITAEKAELRDQMDRIAHTIRTKFNHRWQPYHIRPLHPRVKRGDYSRAGFEVIKTADRPLTTTEITERVALAQGIDRDDLRAFRKLYASIRKSLMQSEKDRALERIDGSPELWQLCEQVWQTPPAVDVYASVPLVRASRSLAGATLGASANSPPVRHQGARWRHA